MRVRPRIDGAQRDIVKGLRRLGVSVTVIAAQGRGVPDLLVGFRRENYLLEVKRPHKHLDADCHCLTPDQRSFHAEWCGKVVVVMTLTDALVAIGLEPIDRNCHADLSRSPRGAATC